MRRVIRALVFSRVLTLCPTISGNSMICLPWIVSMVSLMVIEASPASVNRSGKIARSMQCVDLRMPCLPASTS